MKPTARPQGSLRATMSTQVSQVFIDTDGLVKKIELESSINRKYIKSK